MIHFVGAGPGAVDLITLRGARLLEEADLVVYAGSLVNPALLERCAPYCEVMDSASMDLDAIVAALAHGAAQGKKTVRLHTGDPSIYGAIREQMDRLDELKIPYDVTPGVSSFSAAAATLCAEYTRPGVSQTMILTRRGGRTPVPEGQKLESLATHGASMVLFLTSSMAEAAAQDLIKGGYSPDCPAAVVYKASWPEEKVIRTNLTELASRMAEEGIERTALILVGHFLDDEPVEPSKLYDSSYSHCCRQART